MPLTTAFIDTCRTRVLALPERTAVRTQVTTLAAAETRETHRSAWGVLYNPGGLVDLLERAIRATVNAEADINAAGSATGAVSRNERETLIATLSADYLPVHERPATDAEDLAEYELAVQEDLLS